MGSLGAALGFAGFLAAAFFAAGFLAGAFFVLDSAEDLVVLDLAAVVALVAAFAASSKRGVVANERVSVASASGVERRVLSRTEPVAVGTLRVAR